MRIQARLGASQDLLRMRQVTNMCASAKAEMVRTDIRTYPGIMGAMAD